MTNGKIDKTKLVKYMVGLVQKDVEERRGNWLKKMMNKKANGKRRGGRCVKREKMWIKKMKENYLRKKLKENPGGEKKERDEEVIKKF